MVTTFGDYKKMSSDQLNREKQNLEQKVNNDYITWGETAKVAGKATVGGAMGAGLAAGVTMVAKPEIAENVLKVFAENSGSFMDAAKQAVSQNKVAFGIAAAVALGAAVWTGVSAAREYSVKHGVENSSRLSHVDRVMQERQNAASQIKER
jgi:hypothetical protein